MEKKPTDTVTVYTVQFTGIWGRNRTAKFKSTQPMEANDGMREEDFASILIERLSRALKPKPGGKFRVVRYRNCEKSTYNIGGQDAVSYVIPIMQGETALEVVS